VAVDRHSFKKDATSGSWAVKAPKKLFLLNLWLII